MNRGATASLLMIRQSFSRVSAFVRTSEVVVFLSVVVIVAGKP
jgi:hypothetical protein